MSASPFAPQNNHKEGFAFIAQRTNQTLSLSQLMDEDIQPINFLVDGLLSSGLYILAGPPKSGKSWLALWLCLCIAKGQPVWDLAVQPGGVLYLCLEDNKQRLQNRLLDILGEEAIPDLPVHFMLEADAAGTDLIQVLGRFVESHPATHLIVIDTLQKIRPEGVDHSYAGDYQIIGELKQFTPVPLSIPLRLKLIFISIPPLF